MLAAHYLRPTERDPQGHIQRRPPAVLATWVAETDTFDHFAWGMTPELADLVDRTQASFEELQSSRAAALRGLVARQPDRCPDRRSRRSSPPSRPDDPRPAPGRAGRRRPQSAHRSARPLTLARWAASSCGASHAASRPFSVSRTARDDPVRFEARRGPVGRTVLAPMRRSVAIRMRHGPGSRRPRPGLAFRLIGAGVCAATTATAVTTLERCRAGARVATRSPRPAVVGSWQGRDTDLS